MKGVADRIGKEEFALFVRENKEKFYRLAYSYVRNEELALDLVQDAIVAALPKLSSLRHPEYLRTWFYRILVNQCLMAIRKKVKVEILPLPDEIEAPSPKEDGELMEAVLGLPPELKSVIFLRFYEEMKLADITKVSRVNLNTVKARLYRALKLLRMELSEEDKEGLI